MSWVRGRIGALTGVWLCCQVLSLAAFAPSYCCPAHAPRDPSVSGDDLAHAHHATHSAQAVSSDHCSRPAGTDHCPMAGADGKPCPMHQRSSPAGARAAGPESEDACTLRGTCGGPGAALASLIWVPGILTETGSWKPADGGVALSASRAFLPSASLGIDLPPPRV